MSMKRRSRRPTPRPSTRNNVRRIALYNALASSSLHQPYHPQVLLLLLWLWLWLWLWLLLFLFLFLFLHRGTGPGRLYGRGFSKNTNTSDNNYCDCHDYSAAVTADVSTLMVAALLSSLLFTNDKVEQLTTASTRRLGTMREQSRSHLDVPNPMSPATRQIEKRPWLSSGFRVPQRWLKVALSVFLWLDSKSIGFANLLKGSKVVRQWLDRDFRKQARFLFICDHGRNCARLAKQKFW